MQNDWLEVADKEYRILRGQTISGYRLAGISLIPQVAVMVDSLAFSNNSNTAISLIMGLFSTLPLLAKAEFRARTLQQFKKAGDNMDKDLALKIIDKRQLGRTSYGYQTYHHLQKLKEKINNNKPPEP